MARNESGNQVQENSKIIYLVEKKVKVEMESENIFFFIDRAVYHGVDGY